MRKNNYKFEMIKKDMLRISIAFVSIVMIVIIAGIIVMNNQREQLYLEGVVKSTPLMTSETISRLGNLYIELNREYELQIKEMETGFANRLNKRGDRIYYGVNGKENIDEMINDDYVNGIESIEYVKNNADRRDGESNFSDMITVINASLESDVDRYDDKIDEIFTRLFWMSHTFTGESTELYPCENGCAFVKYYCGDVKCQGELNGDVVPFYRCDSFMNRNNEYGLMYDPFLIRNRKYYRQLEELADSLRTSYTYEAIKRTFEMPEDADEDDEPMENRTKETKTDTVRPDTIDLYTIFEPDGYCEIHSRNQEVFTGTTKTFGGCINQVTCHHGQPKLFRYGPDDEEGTWIDWYMGRHNTDNCSNVVIHNLCFNDGDTHSCTNLILGCNGFYECEEGHPHYACPGHIIVCCFGHTNLRLKVKIMYYEEMLDNFKSIIDNID